MGQKEIINLIKKYPSTARFISRNLNIRINTINNSLKNLVNYGLVVRVGIKTKNYPIKYFYLAKEDFEFDNFVIVKCVEKVPFKYRFRKKVEVLKVFLKYKGIWFAYKFDSEQWSVRMNGLPNNSEVVFDFKKYLKRRNDFINKLFFMTT